MLRSKSFALTPTVKHLQTEFSERVINGEAISKTPIMNLAPIPTLHTPAFALWLPFESYRRVDPSWNPAPFQAAVIDPGLDWIFSKKLQTRSTSTHDFH
jgi:hypothetical protein